MTNVDTIREDVIARYRALSAVVRDLDVPVSRPPVTSSLDELMDRFYELEEAVEQGSRDDRTVSDLRCTFSDLVRKLDEYDEGARLSFSRAFREAEAMANDGVRRVISENRAETEALALRARAQLEDIVNTLGSYLAEAFPAQDLESFRCDFESFSVREGAPEVT